MNLQKELTKQALLLFPSMTMAYEQQHPMHLITALTDSERLVTITCSPGWHFRGVYITICIASPDGPHEVFQYETANIESAFYEHVEANRADALEKLKAMESVEGFTLPKVIADCYQARISMNNPFFCTPLS
jgi:hypothetical protein